MAQELSRERVYDMFGLSEDERAWIDLDVSGYQAARAEADLQREEFVAYLKGWTQIVTAKLAAELEWPWPRVPECAA